jgi:hypothetical protein
LAVERLDTMEDVFRKSFKVRFKNSLGTARFSYRVRDCSFPVAGEYRVTLLASGQLLAQRKMVVATKGKKP